MHTRLLPLLILAASGPAYGEAFQQAKIEAGDALKDRMTELAFDGNVTALIFMLKSLRPEKYKDLKTIHLDLKDWDGDISRLSDEQLDKFLIEIEKRQALLQAQQQAALPPASEAVIEAAAEEIPTRSS